MREQESVIGVHAGVVEATAFGWVAYCLGCGHAATPRPCPHTASEALIALCEAVEA